MKLLGYRIKLTWLVLMSIIFPWIALAGIFAESFLIGSDERMNALPWFLRVCICLATVLLVYWWYSEQAHQQKCEECYFIHPDKRVKRDPK